LQDDFMIKGLIFDKDGTLFDFNATWGVWTKGMLADVTAGDPAVLRPLAQRLGYDLQAERFLPGSLVIASSAGELADVILEFVSEDRDVLLQRMNTAAAQVPQVEAAPLGALFEGLKAEGLRLGIATNDAEAPARAHLQRAGVERFFEFIAGYDSGYGAKPAAGQLQAFCDQTGLAPADCVMIGDSLHDLHAGRVAGMRCVGVLTGPAPRDELAPVADVVLASIGDLPGWIASLN
jgi:phosphoglycolate phosphatase